MTRARVTTAWGALGLALALLSCSHVARTGADTEEPADDAGGTPIDAAIALDAPAVVVDASDESTPPPPGFVRVDGTHLVDGAGRPLLLRAVGIGNWLVAEGYMWKLEGARGDRSRRIEQRVAELVGPTQAAAFWRDWRDAFFNEDDVARIHDVGFNAIRVALNARLLMPEGSDAFDEAGFATLASVVAACRRHGVYVIFDMHAAPGGQTGTNIDDDANDAPDLFTIPANGDRLVTVWTEIARRFAGDTTVLGYDLLNEPIAPDFAKHNGALWPIYRRIGAAIRGVDSRHLLVVEGAQWANNWSAMDAPFDDQLVYSFHKYWDDPSVASMQTYLDKRALWNRPVWVGETGENNDGWYRALFPLLEANDLGWSFWTWKKVESDNNPYAVLAPSGWSAIQAYVKDGAPKPSAAAAQATLDELVANARLARCRFNAHAMCAVIPCP